MIVAAGAVHAQADSDDWKPCGQTTGGGRIERAEILFALDRSGSLEDAGVDPGGTKRRGALEDTRRELTDLQDRLTRLLSRITTGSRFEIDVSVVAFNDSAELISGFSRVRPDNPSDEDIARAISTSGDTDYGPAIEEALEQFESSNDDDATCRILVLFTDGILDPFDTATGLKDFRQEEAAESHVANLLTDLCVPDSETGSYRQRMNQLGISTYVAVLRGRNFERGTGNTHLDFLARASKQAILALTGHGDSPLLDGVEAAGGCESWSENRAGKVIDIEDIGELTDELIKVLLDLELGLLQSRVSCTTEAEAELVGEWPYSLLARDPLRDRPLCTVTAPLVGSTTLVLTDRDDGAGLEWLIDDGNEPASNRRRLSAGDPSLSFNIVSRELPTEEPVGPSAAEVEVWSIWSVEDSQLGDLPGQPAEARQATPVRFPLPDREQQEIDPLIDDCLVFSRATWLEVDGSKRAEVEPFCKLQAPLAGEFEIALEPSDNNRLLWSATLSVGNGDPVVQPRGEPILLKPGDETISLGAISDPPTSEEVLDESFTDEIAVKLIWRSPRGKLLWPLEEQPLVDVEIRVRSLGVNPLECTSEAQVTHAGENPNGFGWQVIDTGCTLLSPESLSPEPRGTVTATVSGGLEGVRWQLADPTAAEETGWQTLDKKTLTPSDGDSRLFVQIEGVELVKLADAYAEFNLIARWSGEGIDEREPQQEQRRAALYLPSPECVDRVEGERVTQVPDDGSIPDRLVRLRAICEINPPPNGRLEVRLTDATQDFDVSWYPVRPGDERGELDVLFFEAEEPQTAIDAWAGPLPPELVYAIEAGIDVEVIWTSDRDYISESRPRRVVVGIPDIPPEHLSCEGEKPAQTIELWQEVPEGQLRVTTGCVLQAPEAGTVTLTVEGAVAGMPWRLPQEVLLAPGDPNQEITIETTGVLPNELHNLDASFELVATLTLNDSQPPADRKLREVQVQLQPRIRIRCTGSPEILNPPIEVPDEPLVVDTGCTLIAPKEAGTVTVSVDGDIGDTPWRVAGDLPLSPGDDDLPIFIETDGALPNQRYETVAEFALAAKWRSPNGVEQGVGEHPLPDQESPEVAVALRARPNSGTAALIAVILVLAGLAIAWLALWYVGRRASTPPQPGEYRLVYQEVKISVTPGGRPEVPGFDAASAIARASEPLEGRRSRLQAAGLTIRATVRWWNLRDVLSGGRARAVPRNLGDPLVAVSPRSEGSERSDCLPVSLTDGAVVVAINRPKTGSKNQSSEHSGHVWILLRARAAKDSTERSARQNLDAALRQLGQLLSKPTVSAISSPPKG